jgi:hypothetical protein
VGVVPHELYVYLSAQLVASCAPLCHSNHCSGLPLEPHDNAAPAARLGTYSLFLLLFANDLFVIQQPQLAVCMAPR